MEIHHNLVLGVIWGNTKGCHKKCLAIYPPSVVVTRMKRKSNVPETESDLGGNAYSFISTF